MQSITDILTRIDSFLGGGNWFVYLLLGTGIFFTIYLKFPQIRYFMHAIKIVRGKFDKKGDKGDTSHFQALTTALSGTVGTGNIAGVALALHLGGPAAIFWMMVTAFLGMTTKFVEVTLSHKYREFDDDGMVSGGPMYFMKRRLNIVTSKGKTIKTGYWLGGLFAIATIFSAFGSGNLPQVNSICSSMFDAFGLNKMLVGGVLAIILGLVIVGGIKRIAKVTDKLVPAMALIYLIGVVAVLITNYTNIIPSFAAIFSDIFDGSAAAGGFLGASLSFAFRQGVNRGLFSNESGQGSAPIAHAAAKAHEPVSEGMVSILEPFIDTIIICFLTAITLLSSGVWNEKFENKFQNSDTFVVSGLYVDSNSQDVVAIRDFYNGNKTIAFTGELDVVDGKITSDQTILHARSIAENTLITSSDNTLFSGELTVKQGKIAEQNTLVSITGESLLHSAPLTVKAFSRGVFGDFGKYIVSIGLLLFAFSTVISWSYYGDRAVTYLVGSSYVIYYRILYVLGFFLASFADTTIIWIVSGITIVLMTVPNLIGLLILHREVKETIKDYWVGFKQNLGK